MYVRHGFSIFVCRSPRRFVAQKCMVKLGGDYFGYFGPVVIIGLELVFSVHGGSRGVMSNTNVPFFSIYLPRVWILSSKAMPTNSRFWGS